MKPKLIIIVEKGIGARFVKSNEKKYDLLEVIEVARGYIDRVRIYQVDGDTIQVERVKLPDETD